MSFGKNIARLRKEKGLTQAELGDILGVSNQAVSKWESETTMPDVMLLPKLAGVLGVCLDDLYGISHDVPAEKVFPPTAAEEDRRILNIMVKADGADINLRIPGKALQAVTELCTDREDEQINAIKSIFESDMTGPLVDVDTEECQVKICIEQYEN